MSRATSPSDWMSNLPWVLLGIRASARDETSFSPAHLVYGAPLRLPGEFFAPGPPQDVKVSDFVTQLQRSLRDMAPAAVEFHSTQPGKRSDPPASLAASRSVFVRVDAVKRPLTPPYIGPFPVLKRSNKTYVIVRNSKPWTVSVDRLKPCFVPVLSALPVSPSSSPMSTSPPATHKPAGPVQALPPAAPEPPDSLLPPAALTPSGHTATLPHVPRTSRFGRHIRPPVRFSP